MKKKILVISGGVSKERAISLDTGKQVAKELKKNSYKVKIIEPNFEFLKKLNLFVQILFLMLYMDSLVKMDIFKQFLKAQAFLILTLE